MIRVGHVVVAGELGGAEHMLRDLARARLTPRKTSPEPVTEPEPELDHVVCVLSPTDALPQFFQDAGICVRDGGRIRENPLSALGRAFGSRAIDWLARVLREEQVDIVHLHTFGSQVLGTRAARAVGAKVVRTEHSTRVYDDPSCWPFSRWSLARTDLVVAISAHVRDVALARAPWIADHVRVVPNGVDTSTFTPRDVAKADTFTFALVGRLEPRKGVDIALRALASISLGNGPRLEIVGDGAELPRLRALTRELGLVDRVTFHGYLDDPRPVLARAHAALASSRKEGLGIAFLEAMAMGLPLVAVPVGGLVEIVEPAVTGLLSRSCDPRALGEAMSELARDRDRARALGGAARGFVEQRYSLDAMRAGYRAVYAKLF